MLEDPKLTEAESKLFELMRDGVIVGLYFTPGAPNLVYVPKACWMCAVAFPEEARLRSFTGSSALDAYMQAYTEIFTRVLEGKQIYSDKALTKRRELGLG